MNSKSVFQVLHVENPDYLEQVYRIRRQVFVDEQKFSAEEEFDAFEQSARHFLAVHRNDDSPAGAARWRETAKGIKLERFCVLPEFRGQGAASALVEGLIADIGKLKPGARRIYLHAQLQAEPFYMKTGFRREGDEFMECGVAHVAMAYAG